MLTDSSLLRLRYWKSMHGLAMAFRFLPVILPIATAMQLDVLSVADRDECACMTWSEVYKTTRTSCGDGCEFFHDTQHCGPTKGQLEAEVETKGLETCKNGLMKLDSSTCINIETSGEDIGQWCYVSNKCNKGHKIPHGELKWKKCDAADPTLKGLPSFKVCDYAWKKGIAVEALLKMTYQVNPDFAFEENNNDVYKFFCGKDDQRKDLNPKMVEALTKLTKKTATTQNVQVFGKTNAGEPPFIVVDMTKKSGVADISEVITDTVPRFQPLACPMDSGAQLMPIPYSGFSDGSP